MDKTITMGKWQSVCKPGEFRALEENGDKYIEGYFAVFNSDYQISPGMSESIDPHAFDDAIDDDIRCLTDHDTRLVIGRTTAGTFELSIDEHGLYGRALVNPNDQDAVNTWERVQRGDVDQCSFGFEIVGQETDFRDDGSIHWTITDVNLFEVSVCTFPAYEETNVAARSRERDELQARRLEAWKSQAKNKLKGA